MSSDPVQRQMRRLQEETDRNERRGSAFAAAARAFQASLDAGEWRDWDVLWLGRAELDSAGRPDPAAGAAKLVTAIQKYLAEQDRIQARLDAMPEAAFAAAGLDRAAHRLQGERAAATASKLAEHFRGLASQA